MSYKKSDLIQRGDVFCTENSKLGRMVAELERREKRRAAVRGKRREYLAELGQVRADLEALAAEAYASDQSAADNAGAMAELQHRADVLAALIAQGRAELDSDDIERARRDVRMLEIKARQLRADVRPLLEPNWSHLGQFGALSLNRRAQYLRGKTLELESITGASLADSFPWTLTEITLPVIADVGER